MDAQPADGFTGALAPFVGEADHPASLGYSGPARGTDQLLGHLVATGLAVAQRGVRQDQPGFEWQRTGTVDHRPRHACHRHPLDDLDLVVVDRSDMAMQLPAPEAAGPIAAQHVDPARQYADQRQAAPEHRRGMAEHRTFGKQRSGRTDQSEAARLTRQVDARR